MLTNSQGIHSSETHRRTLNPIPWHHHPSYIINAHKNKFQSEDGISVKHNLIAYSIIAIRVGNTLQRVEIFFFGRYRNKNRVSIFSVNSLQHSFKNNIW